ncbi:hypothetical protein TNCV_840051 [Trichonephila clavipes]|nr:hypothetical protein TNCV_840051 [Trichonephila clavipes]
MWSMIAHGLTQITPPVATQDQLWQRVEAACTNSEKFEDSCSLDEDDLIGFMTVYGNKEVDNDEAEGGVQLLTADLIRKGLKFATNVEHFLTHDPDIECALKFLRNLKFCVAGYQELHKQIEK